MSDRTPPPDSPSPLAAAPVPATAGGQVPVPTPAVVLTALIACCVPTLLGFSLPPSATLMNQCLAMAGWGGLVVALAPALGWHAAWRPTWPLQWALGLLLLSVGASWGWGSLPASLAASAAALLAAAMGLAATGAAVARRPQASAVWFALALGLLVAGVLSSVVAVVQVFAPGWTDGNLIAHSGIVGRAVGNLRQPNHLCSLLLWALVAVVSCHELGRLPRGVMWLLALLLVFAVELSASRTGAVGLMLMPLWAALDRRLSRSARWLLVAMPLLYALSYLAMLAYGHWSQQALGAAARVAAEAGGADSPNSRLNIWRNAWALVQQQPWTGVGFGEFNLAWSLTPFPGRPTAFFDHTHNLPLQLMAELGLPLASVVLGLLTWALWRAWRGCAAVASDLGHAGRAAWMLVLVIGLHSQVEYPLWYSYFLLPAALAWGFALAVQGAEPSPARPTPTPSALTAAAAGLGQALGLAMALGGMLALQDYRSVVAIYAPANDDARTLPERIHAGQRSPLFAHHADYAATTNPMPPEARALGFARAPHNLLDTRLMIAWAEHLAATGHPDLARALAARVREFGHADADSFFEPCAQGGSTAFQCQLPQAVHAWRSYLATPPGQANLAHPAAQPAPLQAPSATQ